MAFGAVPDNMLELLAGPSLPSGVRFAALVFGVMIIGLGTCVLLCLLYFVVAYTQSLLNLVGNRALNT
jgi:hypothetical protein